MKFIKSTLTILASLLYLTTLGQIKFETGYIVNNDNQKVECLIENKDWLDNPASFAYKLAEGDQPIVATVADVKEFGVYNYSKFLRASVQLDTSNTFVVAKLSNSRKPLWSAKTLFLKSVVAGSANLYRYQSSDLLAFFFNTAQDSGVLQLIHKKYFAPDNKVGENIDFKQQLINSVSCGEKVKHHIANMGYNEPDLKKYFAAYNACQGDAAQVAESTPVSPKTPASNSTRGLINFKVTPGLSFSVVSIQDKYNKQIEDYKFEGGVYFRGGLETEFILPFNKNKWSIFFEPTYQYYEATEKKSNGAVKGTITYQSIEFPTGLRYYNFMKEGSVFFNFILLPGAYIDLTESKITTGTLSTNLESRIGYAVGGGYTRGPFSLEARYYIPQNLVYNLPAYRAFYQRMALIAGFRFLEVRKKTGQ